MAEGKFIKVNKEKQVARITLDRPKHNVLDIEMMKEFNLELEKIASDDDLKCVVITGEGRSFCAGVEVSDHTPEKVDEMVFVFNRIFELINLIDIPVIAAVNGACLGGGLEVAIAADIVIASEKAILGQPEVKLGFFPPYAAIRLPELVGTAKAIEICTTGKSYSAADAETMGFVSKAVAIDQFEETVESYIKEISHASPLILKLNKRAVKRHIGTNFHQAVQLSSDYFLNTMMKTKDTLEGIKSFEEKRRPDWKNK